MFHKKENTLKEHLFMGFFCLLNASLSGICNCLSFSLYSVLFIKEPV